MNAEAAARERAEVVDEVSKWTVGAGVLVVALAPLSLPILILTMVALVPLLVPVLALGLLAVPFLLVRAVIRRLRLRKQVPVRTAVEEQRQAAPRFGIDHVSGQH
jgi:hypothetical protein